MTTTWRSSKSSPVDNRCELRRDTDGTNARTTNRHATIVFEPRPFDGPQRTVRRASRAAVEQSTDGDRSRGCARTVDAGRSRASSILAGRSSMGASTAKPNHVYMCKPVYDRQPGRCTCRTRAGRRRTPPRRCPLTGRSRFMDELVLGDRPRPAVLVLDTGLSTATDGSTAGAPTRSAAQRSTSSCAIPGGPIRGRRR